VIPNGIGQVETGARILLIAPVVGEMLYA